MTIVYSRESQCAGKRTFRRKAQAKHAARQTMSGGTHSEKPGRVVVYRCPWCDLWHVGHPPKV